MSAYEYVFLAFVGLYIVACALMTVVATIILFASPSAEARQIAPYCLGFFFLAALNFVCFRTHFTAVLLRQREKRYDKTQRALTAVAAA